MAVVTSIKCEQCGKDKDVWHASGGSAPKICHECTRINLAQKRQNDLAVISGRPMEERIRRIEEWIYDYKPPVPLSEMRF